MNIDEWNKYSKAIDDASVSRSDKEAAKDEIRRAFAALSNEDLGMLSVDILAVLRERSYEEFISTMLATATMIEYDARKAGILPPLPSKVQLRSDNEWPK